MMLLDIREEPIGIFYPTSDYRSGRMELYFPCALDPNNGLTMQQMRKFFRFCLRYQHERPENEKSVHELEQFLADYVLACKNANGAAAAYKESHDYKYTKKLYERSEKIMKIWNDLKERYL